MPPKKASKAMKRELKHGKNGKKNGVTGSSFFTWFMVIALLGVWTSVAVVWFDLVDYEDVLAKAKDFRYNLSEVLQGKLGVYDADGDGDFDVEDAKILLGLTKDGSSMNIDSLEEVLNILAEESSDWVYGFLSFLYDVMTPFEMVEEEDTDPTDDVDGFAPSPIVENVTKSQGLKERGVLEQPTEDADETDSPAYSKSGLSDADLEDILSDISDDDLNDIEDALDDHDHGTLQSQHVSSDAVADFDLEDAVEPVLESDDVVSDFDLEDALEPSVHEVLLSEHEAELEAKEAAALVAEEDEEQVEVAEPELEEEPAAVEDEQVEDSPLEEEPETVYETEYVAEALEAPNTEADEPADVEEAENEEEADLEPEAEEVEAEEPVADGEQEPQGDHYEFDHGTDVPENQDESEIYEESILTEEEAALTGEEAAALEAAEEELVSDDQEAEGEYEAEHTEESPPETFEQEPAEDDTTVEAEALIVDEDNEEDINDTPLESEPEEETLQPPVEEQIEEADEQIEVEQNEASDHPVEDDRPSDKAEEPNSAPPEKQTEEHAGDVSLSQEKKEKDKKKKPKLLNKLDKTIKSELDAAEKLRKKGKVEEALKAFENLVTKYPQSPKARYGKAQSEDDLAEKQRSNEILLKAISSYEEVSVLPNVPKDLAKLALKRRANRQQFLGRMQGSLVTLQKLVQLYPEDLSLKNDLGVGYLLIGDNNKAKQVYDEVLSLDPNNGFAQVHYGFILKAENKIAESIPYLKKGLLSGEPGTDDGRFYFHLGDALQRVGDKEAYTWYEAGHKKGYFASVWQRSLYNVNGLKAQPWWTAKETGYTDLVRTLETNWKVIRDEGLAVMDDAKGLFLPEDENLRETGDWSQYTLWQQGRKNEKSCKAAPKTCALLERFSESTGCRRGQIKYSVMHPGTHVWPHTGPTNCRLRMHLGLVIPKHGCRIRCANDTRTWEEGKVLIFDDSFEHEVWQDANSYRLIFIIDVWHPELSQHQRRTLPAI